MKIRYKKIIWNIFICILFVVFLRYFDYIDYMAFRTGLFNRPIISGIMITMDEGWYPVVSTEGCVYQLIALFDKDLRNKNEIIFNKIKKRSITNEMEIHKAPPEREKLFNEKFADAEKFPSMIYSWGHVALVDIDKKAHLGITAYVLEHGLIL